jgi:hypothetical protein
LGRTCSQMPPVAIDQLASPFFALDNNACEVQIQIHTLAFLIECLGSGTKILDPVTSNI